MKSLSAVSAFLLIVIQLAGCLPGRDKLVQRQSMQCMREYLDFQRRNDYPSMLKYYSADYLKIHSSEAMVRAWQKFQQEAGQLKDWEVKAWRVGKPLNLAIPRQTQDCVTLVFQTNYEKRRYEEEFILIRTADARDFRIFFHQRQ